MVVVLLHYQCPIAGTCVCFYFLCSGKIPVKRFHKDKVRSKWIKAGEDDAFLFPSTVLNALVFVAMLDFPKNKICLNHYNIYEASQGLL